MPKSALVAAAGVLAAGAIIGGLLLGDRVVAIFDPAPAPTPPLASGPSLAATPPFTFAPSPAPTPPGEGLEGISTLIIVDGPDGGYLQLCRAEAMVTIEHGQVSEIRQKGKNAMTAIGEAVRNQFDSPSGIAFPVHRGPDGVLTFGWEICERVTK